MNWEEIKTILLNDWVLGILIFIGWCIFAYIIKYVIYVKLKVITSRTKADIDNILLDSLNHPMNIVIIILGLAIVWRVMPVNDAVESILNIAAKILIILSITIFVDRFAIRILQQHDKTSTSVKLSQGLIQVLIRTVVYILGIFILLTNIGVNISPLIASLGIGTLAVALALQNTLANFFSGLFIMMDKSIKVGDFIELENGNMGYVEDVGWRASRVRMLTDNMVIIPNGKLVDSIVTNYQEPYPKLFFFIELGVHYDSDLEHVEKVVMEVVKKVIAESDGAMKDIEPAMWFREFGDSSINLRIRVAVREYIAQFKIQHLIVKRIHQRFREEGIVIPFPLRTIDFQPKHLEFFRQLGKDDGSNPKLPD